MKAEKKGKLEKREPHGNIKYDESFKLQVVRETLEGKISKEEANRLYGIRSKSAILEWTRKYSGEKGFDKRGRRLKNKGSELSDQQQADQNKRILELEELLRKEKLKVALSNTMIDIAEEEFGINIRKKSGAKQLKELKKLREEK